MTAVLSAAQRRTEQRAAALVRARRRTRRIVLWTVGVLVVIVVTVWLIGYSSVLAVRTVEVSGATTISADVVRQFAAITPGTPLARVDGAGVESRVGQIPQVESVQVARSWPSTIRLTVVERRPVALVTRGGEQWLIDRTGVLYAQVTAAPAGVLPLTVAQPGPDDRATRAALTVIQALSKPLTAALQGVSADSADSVVLHLKDGRTVIWGGAADSDRKAAILTGLLDQEGTTFDVSSPSSVVIR